MKIFFFFLLVVLSGCTQLQPAKVPVAVHKPLPVLDPVLFGAALDLLSTTQNLSGLREFQQLHPQSPWAERATTIILYVEELHQRKQQLEEKRIELQQLQSDNQQLNGMIEQLKTLLIELEQRPK